MPVLAYEPTSHQIHTPVFDGPLELLLYLIRSRGVDIRSVDIAPITDAYLQHLHQMQQLELDIAGEFIKLAATLCYLKSCELLPNNLEYNDEMSEEDPLTIRERLAQQLKEYQGIRTLAEMLDKRPQLDRDVFVRTQPKEDIIEPKLILTHNATDLLMIYKNLLSHQTKPKPSHSIEKEPFSLRKMGEWILNSLQQDNQTLSHYFKQLPERSEKIVCLLTLLELAKHQMISIAQFNFLSEIHIQPLFTDQPSIEHIFTEE